jgi:hypothetical protein
MLSHLIFSGYFIFYFGCVGSGAARTPTRPRHFQHRSVSREGGEEREEKAEGDAVVTMGSSASSKSAASSTPAPAKATGTTESTDDEKVEELPM